MSSPYKPKTAVSGSRSMVRKPASYVSPPELLTLFQKPPPTANNNFMRKYK
jgi:hypothetical protein